MVEHGEANGVMCQLEESTDNTKCWQQALRGARTLGR